MAENDFTSGLGLGDEEAAQAAARAKMMEWQQNIAGQMQMIGQQQAGGKLSQQAASMGRSVGKIIKSLISMGMAGGAGGAAGAMGGAGSATAGLSGGAGTAGAAAFDGAAASGATNTEIATKAGPAFEEKMRSGGFSSGGGMRPGDAEFFDKRAEGAQQMLDAQDAQDSDQRIDSATAAFDSARPGQIKGTHVAHMPGLTRQQDFSQSAAVVSQKWKAQGLDPNRNFVGYMEEVANGIKNPALRTALQANIFGVKNAMNGGAKGAEFIQIDEQITKLQDRAATMEDGSAKEALGDRVAQLRGRLQYLSGENRDSSNPALAVKSQILGWHIDRAKTFGHMRQQGIQPSGQGGVYSETDVGNYLGTNPDAMEQIQKLPPQFWDEGAMRDASKMVSQPTMPGTLQDMMQPGSYLMRALQLGMGVLGGQGGGTDQAEIDRMRRELENQ